MKTFKYFETGFATKKEVNEALNTLSASKIIDGEVNIYADLPTPANYNGEIWLVKTTTGVIFVNKKVAGLYVSNGTAWNIITPVEIDGYQKLITTPTNDNIAITDANGQTKDGGKKISDLEQIVNKVITFSATPANVKYPTEKLVKDNLDLKEDLLNKVIAFSATPVDTKYPSEKLVKDNLDLKVDKITGKGLSTNDYTTTEKTKLAGIATGATVNSTDAVLLARANHTGSQATSTITGLDTSLSSKEVSANKDASNGYVGLTLFKINFKNVLNTFTSFFTNSNTASRTYTFQDRNGTILDDTNLSGINASIATKQDAITGGATTIATTDLTINRLLVSSSVGKVATSSVSAAEAGYLSGVTSAIQTQLGEKANIAVASNDITMSSFDTLSGTTFTPVPTVIPLNTKPDWAERIIFTMSFFLRVQRTFEISLNHTTPLLISVYRDTIMTSASNVVDTTEYVGFATYTAGTNSLAIRLQRKESGGASKGAITTGTVTVSNIQFRD
ncbi:MAG: hypothetical protein LW595_06175 [Rickettsiales bacterium]|nr:hypothetical protein [Rickettsiales bacterium]